MKYLKVGLLCSMIMIFLTGCLNIPVGDGNSLKLTKDGITVTDKEGEKHSVNVDKDGKKVNIEGFGSNKDDVVEFGEDLDLPKEFPENIPILKDAKINQVAIVEGNITVSYTTKTGMEEIVALYDQHFEDKSLYPNEDEKSNAEMKDGNKVTWKQYEAKGKDTVVAVSIIGGEEGGTLVSINLTKKAE